jgi:hypothetical protein
MDDYKKYFYRREPHLQKLDFGNISEQLELRSQLKCQSFEWYMQNIGKISGFRFTIEPCLMKTYAKIQVINEKKMLRLNSKVRQFVCFCEFNIFYNLNRNYLKPMRINFNSMILAFFDFNLLKITWIFSNQIKLIRNQFDLK